MTERNYSSRQDFKPYTFTNNETGEVYTSPFPVAVLGIRREVLGVGLLIGAAGGELGVPVIAVDDPTTESGKVEILGSECWWACPVDEKMTDLMAAEKTGKVIMLASAYIQKLESDNY